MPLFHDVPLRMIAVCVDYSDYLALTLPYNLHHFDEILVVTAPLDDKTINLVEGLDSERINHHVTDAFYRHGAKFNKWAALEEGLDRFGREGWLVIMDADTVWPKMIPQFELRPGNLYTPFRRMKAEAQIPPEKDWLDYPRHRITRDFSGYTQIFHASDSVLGAAPWHETNWSHAGGADTFFQAQWPEARKIRPPFEVLHLGEPGTNWCGRVSPYADGSGKPEGAAERLAALRGYMRGRQRRRAGQDQYGHEKIRPE